MNDPRGLLLPAYVAVDESGSMGPHFQELTSGLSSLCGTLRAEPMIAAKLRLAVLPRVPDPIEQASGQLTDGLVLLVATDGFGDPLGAGTGEVGQLFARALSAAPPPLRLAQLLDFSRETFDDDRTLLGLWPRGGGMR